MHTLSTCPYCTKHLSISRKPINPIKKSKGDWKEEKGNPTSAPHYSSHQTEPPYTNSQSWAALNNLCLPCRCSARDAPGPYMITKPITRCHPRSSIRTCWVYESRSSHINVRGNYAYIQVGQLQTRNAPHRNQ